MNQYIFSKKIIEILSFIIFFLVNFCSYAATSGSIGFIDGTVFHTSQNSTYPFNVQANVATDPGVSVTKVELYRNDILYYVKTSPPYSSGSVNYSGGTYNWYAKITDSQGGVFTTPTKIFKVNYLPNGTWIQPTTPLSGAAIHAPGASVNFQVNASDTDGSVTKVEYVNTVTSEIVGVANSSPWTSIWNNPAAGKYTIVAKVYDDLGGVTSITPISVLIGTAPTISSTYPSNNDVLGSPASFNYQVNPQSTNPGASIQRVDFYRGTTYLGVRTSAPWTFAINNLTTGSYVLKAIAYDTYDFSAQVETNVRINSLPIVSITTPISNTNFSPNSDINFAASATDSDGTVSKVEFLSGTQIIGTVNSQPWNFTWISPAIGTYNISAKATDNNGGVTTSAVVVVKVANLPQVAFTSPNENQVFQLQSTVNFNFNPVTSNPGATITKVELLKANTVVGTVTSAPWQLSQTNLPAGTHQYTARVTDSFGANFTTSIRTIKINNPPSVNITSPLNNSFQQTGSNLALQSSVSDTDGTVTKVEYYSNNQLVGSSLVPPWSSIWNNLPSGNLTITAKAIDNDNGEKLSTPILIKSGLLPTVTFNINPNGPNTSSPYSYLINSNPTSNTPGVTVANVKAYQNGVLIGTSTSSPWSIPWSYINAGTYNINVVVTDANGATNSSEIGTVLVGNVPPVISYGSSPTNTLPQTGTRTTAFEYDTNTGLLKKEIIEPLNSNLCLVKIYQRDGFGNVISTTTRNCNGTNGSHAGVNDEAVAPSAALLASIDTTVETYEFDTLGRFPTKIYNAIGQFETNTYNQQLGLRVQSTGPDGINISYTYDSFGRQLTQTTAPSIVVTNSYHSCNSTCPDNARYFVKVSSPGKPESIIYYDLLKRVIRNNSQNKDDVTTSVDNIYDSLGRITKTSKPFKSTETIKWTTTTYDILDRPTTITLPDSSVTNFYYSGFITIVKNSLNQTKFEKKNIQGQVVQSTDSYGNSIYFQYDAFGNLIKTIDSENNVNSAQYDNAGKTIQTDDPDRGTTTFTYDVLGRLKKQVDAKNQIITFSYDKLNRIVNKIEGSLNSTFVYDICNVGNATGKCKGQLTREYTDNGYEKLYNFDSYSRLISELDLVDGQSFGISKSYDNFGRVSVLQYPENFEIKNVYSTNGHLIEVRNNQTNFLYWKAVEANSSGDITQEILGNGITNSYIYNSITGLLDGVTVSNANTLINQSYVYDSVGNLKQRNDTYTGLNETFNYDQLNRLTNSTWQHAQNTYSVDVSYNKIGNITFKSDVGNYNYGFLVNGKLTKPHAVSSITNPLNNSIINSFNYDNNGNNISSINRTVSWNSWNAPISITKNSKTYTFVYNSSHERVKQTIPLANGQFETIYNISPRLDSGIHIEKRVKPDGSSRIMYYLYAGHTPFGTVTKSTIQSSVTFTTQYFHRDNVSSIIGISDDSGNVFERRSYDAWGKRRNLNGSPIDPNSLNNDERHGFTGHEELLDADLVHMNGRLYDPSIGRFISADPTIQYPSDTQSYNKYSYINNNPLSSIDYNGYGFLSGLVKGLGKTVGSVMKGVGKVASEVLRNPVVRTVVSLYVGYQFGVNFMDTGAGFFGSGNFVANGAFGGFTSGLIAGRGDLKVAFSGALSGAAFGYVGSLELDEFGSIIAHGIAGGFSNVVSGGDFESGFFSSGFARFGGSLYPNQNALGALATKMVLGGTASVASGGKFGNGARNAAYGYLYNGLAHMLAGRESHNTLQEYLKVLDSTIRTERGVYNTFGQLVGIADILKDLFVWEIKPNNLRGYYTGGRQLLRYTTGTGLAVGQNVGNLFDVGASMVLVSPSGNEYNYKNMGDGLIVWNRHSETPSLIDSFVKNAKKIFTSPKFVIVPGPPIRLPIK